MVAGVNAIPGLKVMVQPDMCLFAFTSDTLDMFQLTDAMLARGFTVQSQFAKPGAPRNIHISLQYSSVNTVDAFLAALRESVEEVKKLPPIDVDGMKAMLGSLIASNDPAMFEKAAALVGIQGQNLPPGMAMISTLLEAMPDEVQSQFLIEYFNNLYAMICYRTCWGYEKRFRRQISRGDAMKRTLKHISYSMGNFANTIAYQVFGNRIQFYYVDILKLEPGRRRDHVDHLRSLECHQRPPDGTGLGPHPHPDGPPGALCDVRRNPAGDFVLLPVDAAETVALDAGCLLPDDAVHLRYALQPDDHRL